MRLSLPRLLICLQRTALLLLLIVIIAWHALSNNHPTRVWFRTQYYNICRRSPAAHKLIPSDPSYYLNLSEDVGLIVKTGYGTRERVPGQLQWIGDGPRFRDMIVIGDYASTVEGDDFSYRGTRLQVHDAVAVTMQSVTRGLSPQDALAMIRSSGQLLNYTSFHVARAKNDSGVALSISQEFGWKLDALKFISGLELAYRLMPSKRWYIMVDDDTYLMGSTLKAFLSQFNPLEAHYLGNGIGAWYSRFAHGGSAIIMSQGALDRLFVDNSPLVPSLYKQSLTERYGDEMVSKALMKVGVYLDERYNRIFSGEPPALTKIRNDRFCAPLMTFHAVKTAEEVSQVHSRFKDVSAQMLWVDLWGFYGAPSFDSLASARADWDHVGRLDEYTTTVQRITGWEDCSRLCRKKGQTCIAWTWQEAEKVCHMSPWMILGEKREGSSSGLNVPAVKKLAGTCKRG
ncbi:hypothetical protein BX600DRAFT_391294 [Xylariales sp. PMI_506]|nr:hypothetical protein BX600DRAFT_391294 [Xylariales sp. PMI_506]